MRATRTGRRLAGVAIFAAAWEVGAAIIAGTNPQFHDNLFPSLGYIFTASLKSVATFATVDLTQAVTSSYLVALIVLAENSLITLQRLVGGTLAGLVIGIGLGVGIGSSLVFRRLFGPLINLVRTVPLLALIPLFLVWFGGAPIGIYLYIIFAIAMFMVVYTVNAIQNVPPIYLQFARTLGASRVQIFRSVTLPAIFPELFGGIRVCMGISWGVTLAGEYLAAQDGLGRILIWSQIYMFAGRMVIIVLLFMLYAMALNWAVLSLRRRMLRWMP